MSLCPYHLLPVLISSDMVESCKAQSGGKVSTWNRYECSLVVVSHQRILMSIDVGESRKAHSGGSECQCWRFVV